MYVRQKINIILKSVHGEGKGEGGAGNMKQDRKREGVGGGVWGY